MPIDTPLCTDSPPIPQTRLMACEYVFDAATEADADQAEEVAGLLDVYLFWRETFAARMSHYATLN
jgi:hypothetical protein